MNSRDPLRCSWHRSPAQACESRQFFVRTPLQVHLERACRQRAAHPLAQQRQLERALVVVLTVSLGLDLKQFGLHQLVEQFGQLASVDLIAETTGIARIDDSQCPAKLGIVESGQPIFQHQAAQLQGIEAAGRMGESGMGEGAVFGWRHGLLHDLEWRALSLMAVPHTIHGADLRDNGCRATVADHLCAKGRSK